MKILVIGDIHGINNWKKIIETELDFDKVIFIGDYFDSFNVPYLDQMNNFKNICQFKKESDKEIILLIGNHDFHYWRGIQDKCSGYQKFKARIIDIELFENKELFQICYNFENFLFTHAGVSSDFLDLTFGKDSWDINNISNDLNELFKYKPNSFAFNGVDNYGDDVYQTPIWIRPNSLIKGTNQELKDKYIQIVGHTPQKEIRKEGNFYFIDALYNYEYLLINDNEVIRKKI